MNTFLGKKLGMTQIFSEEGAAIPVTVIEAGPMVVTQIKTEETDGYNAVQIGFGEIKEHKLTQPMKGHFAKAQTAPKRYLTEIRVDDPSAFELGQEFTVAELEEGAKLDVTRNPRFQAQEITGRPGSRYLSVQSIQGQQSSGKNGSGNHNRSEPGISQSSGRQKRRTGQRRGPGTEGRPLKSPVRSKGSEIS